MRCHPFVVNIILAFSAGIIPGVVLAAAGPYLGTGHFPAARIQWHYSGPEAYRAPHKAAAARWSTATDLDIDEVMDKSWQVLSNVADYPATWAGYAYICSQLCLRGRPALYYGQHPRAVSEGHLPL
jgi:hypothetical protein